ncbi:MAG: hypothetical protein Q8911_10245 [Bacillota bacterium]|nr:hypothetical protein [Bacillota bacterium]
MKKNDLWLSPEELQQMMRGSLQWLDVVPRLTTFRNETPKLRETAPKKKSLRKQIQVKASKVNHEYFKGLEGQPVVWLLGSIGLLTLSTWFYFVLFIK